MTYYYITMKEKRNQEREDFNDIKDVQERVFFQLKAIWEINQIDTQKITAKLNELKVLHIILYLLITSGIMAFLILFLTGIHLFVIMIDFGIVTIFLVYLKYLNHTYRKNLKLSKKDLKYFISFKKKDKYKKTYSFESIRNAKYISALLTVIYLIIICSFFFLLIISINGLNPIILVIVIVISLTYVFFDRDDFKSNI